MRDAASRPPAATANAHADPRANDARGPSSRARRRQGGPRAWGGPARAAIPPKRALRAAIRLAGRDRPVLPCHVIAREDVTGVVLAGGQGRRMGGIDKGLVPFRGAPMVAHAIARLAPQVAAIVVNANQNAERYREFGHPVVPDAVGGYAGPLAGLHAGLAASATPYVATVPCDSPFLPGDLVARLAAGLEAAGADVAVARTFDQPHPVFALVRASVRSHLEAFLAAGGRKIDAWYATLAVAEIPFDDEADAFRNINTRDELAAAGGP